MKRNDIIGLVVAIAVFAGAIAFILSKNIIITSQAIEVTLLFVLVLVTIIYAKRTSEIADATKKQAREVREQRYSESLPLLVLSVTKMISKGLDPDEIAYESLQSGLGLKVVWRNVGKGVAINLRFSLHGVPLPSGKVPLFQLRESQALESGGQKETDPSKWDEKHLDKPGLYQPRLEAEYQDIYERKITTVQEFRIDEEDKTAFLGDLYFTVNGKRLGEELTQHD
jgi:hypothetical protein